MPPNLIPTCFYQYLHVLGAWSYPSYMSKNSWSWCAWCPHILTSKFMTWEKYENLKGEIVLQMMLRKCGRICFICKMMENSFTWCMICIQSGYKYLTFISVLQLWFLLLLSSKWHWVEKIGWASFPCILEYQFLCPNIFFKKPKYLQFSYYLEKNGVENK